MCRSILLATSFTFAMTLATEIASASPVNVLEVLSPESIIYRDGFDIFPFVEGVVDDVTAALAVPSVDALGCAAADFAGFAAGSIALIERGACYFSTKLNNAAEAGAVGAIVYSRTVIEVGGRFALADPTNITGLVVQPEVGDELLGLLATNEVRVRLAGGGPPIPEPGGLLLFTTGILLVGGALRRRRT